MMYLYSSMPGFLEWVFLISLSLIVAFLLVYHLIGRHTTRSLRRLRKNQMVLLEQNIKELWVCQTGDRTGKVVKKTGRRSPRPFHYFDRVRQAQSNPKYSGGLTWILDGFQDVVRERHSRVCGR